jgi:hypothetical protein
MKKILALLLFLIPVSLNAQCIDHEIYKIFLEQKFNMKLYSWAVDKNGSETLWLYVNEHKHFAIIRVGLNGCSTLDFPEDQLSFFIPEKPPTYNPNQNMPMTRGDPL